MIVPGSIALTSSAPCLPKTHADCSSSAVSDLSSPAQILYLAGCRQLA